MNGAFKVLSWPIWAQSAGFTTRITSPIRPRTPFCSRSIPRGHAVLRFRSRDFQNALINGVKSGQISEATLNQAVARVLRVKFMLGFIDRPFVDENLDATVRHSADHNDLALESARQSMCLLKNENNLLPLKKDLKRLAVIGPNANIARYGDYTEAATENSAQGMFAQIKQIVSAKTEVSYADGEDIKKSHRVGQKSRHGNSGPRRMAENFRRRF